MAMIPLNPDVLYDKDRASLLKYEDARVNSLLQACANYYTSITDQSNWGAFLRVFAQELARLDYDYAYDLVGKDPRFLTPPDIIRRWELPLSIPADFPASGQFDLDFKLMMQRLLVAYRGGATLSDIAKVVFAYTLQTSITVVELYKLIGPGSFYDQSDRNTVLINVQVGDLTTLQALPGITGDLYGAVDLVKPAHVGVNLTTIFGEDENIDTFIIPSGSPPVGGIEDQLIITYQLVEVEPFPPQLTLAPLLNPSSPVTVLTPTMNVSPPTSLPPGVLIPRLDQVWEISGDAVTILDES